MILGQGAEAIVESDGKIVVKKRISKDYRINQIDEPLRKFRTKREAKVLDTLTKLQFASPKLISMDDKQMNIEMEHINGEKVRDVLHTNNLMLGKEIGEKVATMHNNNIIHGDLTTSNMILNKEIFFIDFGLSFFSEKVEDKAVDIHLLRQALESKHNQIYEKTFESFLDGYKKCKNYDDVMKRFEVVEARGRNKSKF